MNKITFLIFSFSLLIFNFSIAQTTAPSIQWQKSLGGTNSDYGMTICQINNSGYYTAGATSSNNGDISGNHNTTGATNDFLVLKLDATGTIIWQKCFGGTNEDIATKIIGTNDGNLIIVGRSESTNGDVTVNNGSYDVWVVKIDTLGNILWQKSYGGMYDEYAYSIEQTSDNGYIIAGYCESNDGDVSNNYGMSDAWILKIDSIGTIQWEKSLGGSGYDGSSSVIQTIDGGYIVSAYSASTDGDVTGIHGASVDWWIVKLDSTGTLIWQKTYGGTGWDEAKSIKQQSDGSYIISGYNGSNDGDVTGHHGSIANYDYWIVKIDSIGNLLWQKSLGGTSMDYAWDINITSTGEYIVFGSVNSNDGDVIGNHGYADCWVLKLDTSGNVLWKKTMGGTSNDNGMKCIQTIDGGIILIGNTDSNNGDVSGNHGGTDNWIVKLNSTTGIEEILISNETYIYPNPSKSSFTIQVPTQTKFIEVSNSLGQLLEKRIINNERELNFEIKENGLYIIKVITDKETVIRKVVINK